MSEALRYAMGDMNAAERDVFEALLATGDAAAIAEADAYLRVAETLLVEGHGWQQYAPGIQVLRKGQGSWTALPYPGVSYQLLHVDQQSRTVTSILALKPGSEYPAHRHAVCEQCLVLAGDVEIGGLCMTEGDFGKASEGTEHTPIRTRTGCKLLIVSGLDDEIFA